MLRRTPSLLSSLAIVILPLLFACAARAQSAAPSSILASARAENDRDRDGLQGPVRRIRTENAKLIYKEGKQVEGQHSVMETATYDMKGAKIDNAYFLGASGALTGREVYKYDEKGNIVEMTLFNADGSVMSKEKYDYEFDAMGNWTKMLSSVAVIENGKMSFEPTEVTFRFISYYLEDSVTKKLAGQPAAVAPASAPAMNASAAAPKTQQPQPTGQPAAPKQQLASLPSAMMKSQAPGVAALNAPTATVSTGVSAPVVKVDDDLPPPPKPVVKAPVRPISGGVLNSKALSLPAPLYPEIAKRSRTTGMVVVEVVIDVSGRVIAAKAVSGPEMLRDAAERAAMLAKFTPALLSGQPVKMTGTINYNFTL
ncbi:MAG: periplasmic protein TonB [Acidobacteriota bacterium]|jgi:protein TonB|nr:periplasmic protein TonB [Acidobacteriota bacterium]